MRLPGPSAVSPERHVGVHTSMRIMRRTRKLNDGFMRRLGAIVFQDQGSLASGNPDAELKTSSCVTTAGGLTAL